MTVRPVSGFSAIRDQEQPVRILTTLLAKGTVPHALLFTGVDGVGKRSTAVTFAMACNCAAASPGRAATDNGAPAEEVPCGRCPACRRIAAGSHPDLLVIEPTPQIIRIAAIRELVGALSLKPYQAAWRVVIVDQAEKLNPEAGNALLKVLEEPPARTVLILTAPQATDLLPTIVSRCQHLRFGPLGTDTIDELLRTRHGIDAPAAGILARLANGSISRALTLHRHDWVTRRAWLFDTVERLPSSPVTARLALAEALARDKKSLEETFAVLTTWLRDAVVYRYDPARIINKDLTHRIQYVSQRTQTEVLLNMLAVVEAARRNIAANANPRLTLEVMILKLAGLSAGRPPSAPSAAGCKR